MKSTAKLKYLRIAPRKVRLVADLVRGKKVEDAAITLRYTFKKASDPVLRTLNSAIASAKDNFQLEESDLYISKITVDEGPKLKRWRARARGMAYEIQKKTSHITIELDSKRRADVKKVKKQKAAVASTKSEETTEKQREMREKFRPESEIKKEGRKGITKMFRRKAI